MRFTSSVAILSVAVCASMVVSAPTPALGDALGSGGVGKATWKREPSDIEETARK